MIADIADRKKIPVQISHNVWLKTTMRDDLQAAVPVRSRKIKGMS